MQIEAYALGGGRISLRVPLAGDGDESSKWIHVATCGEWKGHPAGPFAFTVEIFKQLKASFTAQKNPIPLTYEHGQAEGQPRPAAGWITDLELRGADLYAFVEFTDSAAAMVKAGEYKFCSVVVGFEGLDRETGEETGPELFEVGLTNTPFLDGLEAIKLSRVSAANPAGARRSLSMTDAELIKAASKELGDNLTLDTLVALVNAEKAKQAVLAGEPAEEEVAEMAAAPEDTTELAEVVEDVVEAAADVSLVGDELLEEPAVDGAAAMLMSAIESAGVAPDAAVAAIQERPEDFAAFAMGAVEEGAADAAGLSVVEEAASAQSAALTRQVQKRDAENVKLSNRIATLELDARELRIDESISLGHLDAADKPKFMKLAKLSPGLLGEFLDAGKASPFVPTGSVISPKSPNSDDDGSDITEATIAIHVLSLKARPIFKNDPAACRAQAIKNIRSAQGGEHAQA